MNIRRVRDAVRRDVAGDYVAQRNPVVLLFESSQFLHKITAISWLVLHIDSEVLGSFFTTFNAVRSLVVTPLVLPNIGNG